MKTYFKIAIVPLLVITILCVGCNRANNEPKPENIAAIPRYEELSALIGLSPDEAEQKLQGNLTETEPEYDDIYQTPITVELCDVTLYIQLAENSMVKKSIPFYIVLITLTITRKLQKIS